MTQRQDHGRGLQVVGGALVLGCLAGSIRAETCLEQPTPTVVELFTSQGCSSCPSADAVVVSLARKRDVLPLAYHVDYWNDLGWRDPFSSTENTQRQMAYASALGSGQIGTPQFVVNGAKDGLGANADLDLSAAGARHARVPVRLSVRPGQVEVVIAPVAPVAAYDVWAVYYRASARTLVSAGENGGRWLEEANVVMGRARLGSWPTVPARGSIVLKDFPAQATHVAVLVQRTGTGPIIGAASCPLEPAAVGNPLQMP